MAQAKLSIEIVESRSGEISFVLKFPPKEERKEAICIEVVSQGVFHPGSSHPAKLAHARYVNLVKQLVTQIFDQGYYGNEVHIRFHGAITEGGENEAQVLTKVAKEWQMGVVLDPDVNSGDVDSILYYCASHRVKNADVLVVNAKRQNGYLLDVMNLSPVDFWSVGIPIRTPWRDYKSWRTTQFLKRVLLRLGMRDYISYWTSWLHKRKH